MSYITLIVIIRFDDFYINRIITVHSLHKEKKKNQARDSHFFSPNRARHFERVTGSRIHEQGHGELIMLAYTASAHINQSHYYASGAVNYFLRYFEKIPPKNHNPSIIRDCLNKAFRSLTLSEGQERAHTCARACRGRERDSFNPRSQSASATAILFCPVSFFFSFRPRRRMNYSAGPRNNFRAVGPGERKKREKYLLRGGCV